MIYKNIFFLLYSFILFSLSFSLDGDVHDFFLPNGLKVILMERHGAPQVAVNIAYNVGSHDEPAKQRGINQLTKDIVLGGTELYPFKKLSKIEI